MIRLNGLDFHVETEGDGPPLLLLHGFTGSLRAWDEVRPHLARHAHVIALDLIGHGRSAKPGDAARYTLDWAARDLRALLDARGLRRVAVLGYSMGGRLALHFAMTFPENVSTLILESASPGIEDACEREQRAARDDALAESILRDGVSAFVDRWQRQPLLAPAPHVSAERRALEHARRLDNEPLGLANSLRGMGAGHQTPLWDRLSDLSIPVHLIVGERDQRYCAIARRMQALIPRCALLIVPTAGHTVHVDQPARFVRLVESALDNKLTGCARRC